MLRNLTRLSLALALTLGAACSTNQVPDYEPGLYRFSDCGQLREYVAEVMLESLVGYQYGGWGWYALEDDAEAGGANNGGGEGPTDYTTTNTQEEGVDELDIVKTDGTHIYTVQDYSLHILSSWPVEQAELLASVELEGRASGLFLHGDQVIVLSQVWGDELLGGTGYYGGTRLEVYDVSEPSAPAHVRTVDMEGYLADGRMVDGDVYLVVNHWRWLPDDAWSLLWGEDALELPEVDWNLTGDELETARQEAMDEAREILRPHVRRIAYRTDLNELLPVWDLGEGAGVEVIHDCADVYRPAKTAQYNVLSVVHYDMDSDELSATGVLSDGWTVYASADNLYVAQTSWWWWWGWGDLDMSTHIHKFHIADGAEPEYRSTGVVHGWLYDQFAMSEYEDRLRVTTTDFDWWWWTSDSEEDGGNNLFVLEDDGAGSLEQVGSVEGIAPGERIYATRMLGDIAYMVTFEQTDPLWVIDLDDPREPEVVGELEMPGYSAYLHPVGEDHLLAVGMDGTEEGQLTGVAVNLFDVSDKTAPVLAHQYVIQDEGWSWSEALWDHHAFTFHRDVLSIPAYTSSYDDAAGHYDYFSGLYAFSVDTEAGIGLLGAVDHRDLVEESECLYAKWYDYEDEVCDDWAWYASLRRSVYIEDNLFSISNYGVKVNELNDPQEEITRVLFYPAD